MLEANIAAVPLSRNSEVPIFPRRELLGPGKFGRVCKALWPHKTAAHLAAKSHVTERAAKHWIAGTREPSAHAVAAIVLEMLE